jgi:cob(I)alamin adenosyltransferase
MAIKIYTKTGDKGSTALIGGTKVPKSHLRIEAYGTVDELNSFIGLLGDHLAAIDAGGVVAGAPVWPVSVGSATDASGISQGQGLAYGLAASGIQDRLFTIGASLACDPEKESKLKIPDLKEEDVERLEKEIDRMEAELSPLKAFLLPGGHIAVSNAHITRCVCRRAERSCVRLAEEGLFVEPAVIRYLNRLSDYLFVLARYIAFKLHVPEIPWTPRT